MPRKKKTINQTSLMLALNHVKSLSGGKVTDTKAAGAAIKSGSAQMMDVRFMCSAINYPYMFENPCGDLLIECQWSGAFTLTCMAIDAFLGDDKRGFCWWQLETQDGKPRWDWALGKEYDHKVMVIGQGDDARVRVVKPAADPKDELRNAIRNLVDEGMRRTSFFYKEANDPLFKRGGLQ